MKVFPRILSAMLCFALLASVSPVKAFAQQRNGSLEARLAKLIREKLAEVDSELARVEAIEKQIESLRKEFDKTQGDSRPHLYAIVALAGTTSFGFFWFVKETNKANMNPRKVTALKIFALSQTLLFLAETLYVSIKYADKMVVLNDKIDELEAALDEYAAELAQDQSELKLLLSASGE